MLAILEIASATFGFCRKIYCWARTGVRDDENIESPRNFFQAKLKKENMLLLVTGFATVSKIANHCQIPRCIIKFCYTWNNK